MSDQQQFHGDQPVARRIAVVMMNLGGPDSLEAVRPFLFNLFNDAAIISAPQPFRWLIAMLISRRRAPVAQEIYRNLGGASPLLPNTVAQAEKLEAALTGAPAVKCFIAMRYWHPFTQEAVEAVKEWEPDRIVLLPLYPQYSVSTTGSSVKAWTKAVKQAGLEIPTRRVCCYPTEPGFVSAMADLIRPALDEASSSGPPRLLFSAHGLPKKQVERGDPYQRHVEQSAEAVAAALDMPDLDWLVSYQSRVGPLEWLKPYTEDEIHRAGDDKVPLVVVPIAFVSEHSETLVELDIEYREEAEKAGVPHYIRVPTVSTHPYFIEGLANLVSKVLDGDEVLCHEPDPALCLPDLKTPAVAT